jgi:mRNA-degrading endonuclease RelE of RelBE toxin-antitoxin system
MTYKLDFLEEALAEWSKLNPSIKQPLKKLIKVLENPRIPKTSCQEILTATRSNFVVLVIVWFMRPLAR